jgi:hypothetical protein
MNIKIDIDDAFDEVVREISKMPMDHSKAEKAAHDAIFSMANRLINECNGASGRLEMLIRLIDANDLSEDILEHYGKGVSDE